MPSNRRTTAHQRRKTDHTKGGIEKTPTGISGLDEITQGGLPRGRPTLVCGSAGCGKTLLGMEFLVRGAMDHDEPGVFMAFEENEEELTQNVASLGFDLNALCARKKLALDHVRVERSEIEETGEFDLEGLFIRLNYAIDSVGAKRVVLDTVEALFAGFPNEAILRAELRRLFRWLKNKGVTAIITGERGEKTLTRHGLEEYVADCVILLEHSVHDQISTRRLRIVKYRGSSHATNEFPFLIGHDGISVLPITSLGLEHEALRERVSTGIPRLDTMLGGKGYHRGSSILVSGTSGTGKTSIGISFAAAAAKRGERALYFSFEESQRQIVRNMASIGLNLAPLVKKGLLHFHAYRPTHFGLELHLLTVHDYVKRVKPKVVVVDPVTNLINVGTETEVRSMLTRLIDFFKEEQITAIFTSLTAGASAFEESEVGVSSLMDTWILLRNMESGGERNRVLYVLKSRGTAHSNQVREFLLTEDGIELADVYLGPGEVLTGTARVIQENRDRAEAALREQAIEQRHREIEREREATEAQVAHLRAGLEARVEELNLEIEQEKFRQTNRTHESDAVAQQRMADPGADSRPSRRNNGDLK